MKLGQRILTASIFVTLTAACGVSHPTETPAPATPSIEASLTAEPTATDVPLSDGSFLKKPAPNGIRVLSYNMNWDSIFPTDDVNNHDLRSFDRSGSFQRMVGAISPDVLCLQEINPDRDPSGLALLLDGILGVEGDQNWQAMITRDTAIATHFELINGFEMNVSSNIPGLNQAAALINLPEEYGAEALYVICAHFKSGSEIADARMRQRQADALMNHLRDARTPGEEIDLAGNTPFVILGDFNIYDSESTRPLDTILSGDIDNEAVYGPDFFPDWDQTSLTDATPSHNDQGMEFYTWRDDGQPFMPGILDRIFFSDSGLQEVNSFILNSTEITDKGLETYRLQANDVLLETQPVNFDHLPLVVDFVIVRN